MIIKKNYIINDKKNHIITQYLINIMQPSIRNTFNNQLIYYNYICISYSFPSITNFSFRDKLTFQKQFF